MKKSKENANRLTTDSKETWRQRVEKMYAIGIVRNIGCSNRAGSQRLKIKIGDNTCRTFNVQ